MPRHYGNHATQFGDKQTLYRRYIGEGEYLVIIYIRDGMVLTAYESSDGERYIYRKTFIHEDQHGYFLTRDKRKFYIPPEVMSNIE